VCRDDETIAQLLECNFKALSSRTGRQSTLSQIDRIFGKDVLPYLGQLTVFEIARANLLEVLRNPAADLDIVAVPSCGWSNCLHSFASCITTAEKFFRPAARARHTAFAASFRLSDVTTSTGARPDKLSSGSDRVR
jgi:hypothetical protein